MDTKLVVVLFIVVVLFFNLLTVIIAPGKYFKIDGHQYFLSHPLKKNWFEARRHCTVNCLLLVDITDDDENDRILSIVKDLMYINDPEPHYWTSGTDLGSEGQFYWATNAQSVFYSDYSGGQPDNAGGEENCIEIRGEFGFKWNDHICSDEKYFICRNPVLDPRYKPVRVANASMGYTYV